MKVLACTFVALLLSLSAPAIAAQETSRTDTVRIASPLSLHLQPELDLPLGGSSAVFDLGGGLSAALEYALPGTPLTLSGDLAYSFAPIKAATSLSVLSLRVGGGLVLPLGGGVSAYAWGRGGLYGAAYNDFSKGVFDPSLAAGLGLRLALAPAISLDAGATYKAQVGLSQALGVTAGVSISLGDMGGTVEIPEIRLLPGFPVFYKYYDDHSIGTVRLESRLKAPADSIVVEVLIRKYMDSPKVTKVPGGLAPGASRELPLFALFNDGLLGITEGTKVAAEITVTYKVEGRTYTDRSIATLELWGRNAMTWDDDRKAAAFVTAKDGSVLNFARAISGYVREQETRALNDNLVTAMAFHEAIALHGVNYVPSPETPYEIMSTQKDAVDFLQFPRETLQYKAGDCSDLAILYGALFQAVGIDAAFITVPGHIFIAADSGLTPAQAPKELLAEGQFIPSGGKAWIPIEVTSIHDGFLRAWQLGAKEWAEGSLAGTAVFYPIKEAWLKYPPVGLPGAEPVLAAPLVETVFASYKKEAERYLDTALAPQVTRLQDQIAKGGGPAALNSLGVLYAKYGQTDKAVQQFKLAVAKAPYLLALINLGSLYFSRGSWNEALAQYRRAADVDPTNARVVLGIARTNLELLNFAEAKSGYERLQSLNPDLARHYSYLGEGRASGTRAADVQSERRAVTWETGE